MRTVPQFEELKAKYQRKKPLYPGRTLRDIEPFERAAAGRDVNDHRPKAWLELSHPQSVLVAGRTDAQLLSRTGLFKRGVPPQSRTIALAWC